VRALTAGALPEQQVAAQRPAAIAGWDVVVIKPYTVEEFEAALVQYTRPVWTRPCKCTAPRLAFVRSRSVSSDLAPAVVAIRVLLKRFASKPPLTRTATHNVSRFNPPLTRDTT
jgi:hypothetical protein